MSERGVASDVLPAAHQLVFTMVRDPASAM